MVFGQMKTSRRGTYALLGLTTYHGQSNFRDEGEKDVLLFIENIIRFTHGRRSEVVRHCWPYAFLQLGLSADTAAEMVHCEEVLLPPKGAVPSPLTGGLRPRMTLPTGPAKYLRPSGRDDGTFSRSIVELGTLFRRLTFRVPLPYPYPPFIVG